MLDLVRQRQARAPGAPSDVARYCGLNGAGNGRRVSDLRTEAAAAPIAAVTALIGWRTLLAGLVSTRGTLGHLREGWTLPTQSALRCPANIRVQQVTQTRVQQVKQTRNATQTRTLRSRMHRHATASLHAHSHIARARKRARPATKGRVSFSLPTHPRTQHELLLHCTFRPGPLLPAGH